MHTRHVWAVTAKGVPDGKADGQGSVESEFRAKAALEQLWRGIGSAVSCKESDFYIAGITQILSWLRECHSPTVRKETHNFDLDFFRLA